MKELKQVTVIGLGLLGGSVALTISRSMPEMAVVGFSHRASTRDKARNLSICDRIADDLAASVVDSDIVILATPISTFEDIFKTISKSLKAGAIVTDVGSTKVLPHRWAGKQLGKSIHYVGSHPIAGSEQRGLEFSRDDLFERADCIVTGTRTTDKKSAARLVKFWGKMGCRVKSMSPSEHDRIFANVSHVPHLTAASLVNSNKSEDLRSAGKGFMDTSRVASGPANIWVDILASNARNCSKGINRLIKQLERFRDALDKNDNAKIEKLLDEARSKRAGMIKDKLKKKELLP